MTTWEPIIQILQNFGTATLIVVAAMYALYRIVPVLWLHYVERSAMREAIDKAEAAARIELNRIESEQRQKLLGLQIHAAEQQAKNVLTAMGTLSGMQEELMAMRAELQAMREELEKLREIYTRNFDVVERMERIVADLVESMLAASADSKCKAV